METAGTYENLLSAFYEDPKVRRCDVTIPEGASLRSISISSEYLKDGAYGINTSDQNPEDAARWAEDYTRDRTSEPPVENAVIYG